MHKTLGGDIRGPGAELGGLASSEALILHKTYTYF